MLNKEINQQAKKNKCNTMSERLRGQVLGTTHKIKTVIPAVFPGIYTHFKCILHSTLKSFVIYFSCFMMSILNVPLFLFFFFVFYSKIALQPINYRTKILVAKMLVQRYLWQKYIDLQSWEEIYLLGMDGHGLG